MSPWNYDPLKILNETTIRKKNIFGIISTWPPLQIKKKHWLLLKTQELCSPPYFLFFVPSYTPSPNYTNKDTNSHQSSSNHMKSILCCMPITISKSISLFLRRIVKKKVSQPALPSDWAVNPLSGYHPLFTFIHTHNY